MKNYIILGLMFLIIILIQENIDNNIESNLKINELIKNNSLNQSRFDSIECIYIEERNKINDFWDIISILESSGGKFMDGDSGLAKGEFHIHIAAIKDVNKKYNTKFTHNDMYDRDRAQLMGSMYLNINTRRYLSKYGRYPTKTQLARSWNGGFGGINNKLTEEYGNKFNNYLNDI